MAKKQTQEEFISKANRVHGQGTYDYGLVEYKNSNTKVAIVCPAHGLFTQKPYHHTAGVGCPDCGRTRTAESKRKLLSDFIDQAREIHKGSHYDYSLVEYKNAGEKIKIMCPAHGIFEQTPSSHLSGNGCPACGVNKRADSTRLTTQEFIRRSREVHGNFYNYDFVDYKCNDKDVTIVCPIHGKFGQMPSNHWAGKGCPECKKVNASERFRLSESEIMSRMKYLYGDRYILIDGQNISNRDNVVSIKCIHHGVVNVKVSALIRGYPCHECRCDKVSPVLNYVYLISVTGPFGDNNFRCKIGKSCCPPARVKALSCFIKKVMPEAHLTLLGTWPVHGNETVLECEKQILDYFNFPCIEKEIFGEGYEETRIIPQTTPEEIKTIIDKKLKCSVCDDGGVSSNWLTAK